MTMQQDVQTNGKGKGRLNAIGNFYVDAVSDEVMHAFISEHSLDITTEGVNAEQIAVALTQHFRDTTSDDDMAKCARCAGEAPAAISDCPFCGLKGNIVETPPAQMQTQAAPEPAASSPAIPAEVVTEDAPKPPKAAKKTSAKKTAATSTPAEGDASANTNGHAPKGLAKTRPEGVAAGLSVSDLDRAIEDVVKFRAAAAAGYWAFGQTLLEINEKQLWKLREREDGKGPRYKSFNQFLHEECKVTETHAYDAMKCAREFTREKIEKLGKTNAILLLKIPEEARAEIEEKIETGAPTRQIAEEVKRIKKKTGGAKKSQQAKAGEKGAKARAKKLQTKADREKITIASMEGTKTIALYKKPETLRNLDVSQLKPAKTLADLPFGIDELTNEVTTYYAIKKNKAGNLVLVKQTRREAAEE